MKIEQKVIGFIKHRQLINEGDKLLVAFSGGPDSVFLLYFLNKYKKKYKIEITTVHFNHNLRGKESDSDELFCEEFCEKLNIPFYSAQLDVKGYAKQNKISIEEAARKLRYKNLKEICLDFDCDKITTAHNLNDNTETVLLNFLSGGGYTSLSGIPVKRENIIRPILSVKKEEIVEYLNSNKIPFRIDSSNLKNDFKRNFLRNRIIPQLKGKINPSLDEAVFRSSKHLEDSISFIDQQITNAIPKFVEVKKGILRINLSLFESNSKWFCGEILKKVLRDSFNHDFDNDDFNKISSLMNLQKGKSVQLTSTLIATRESKLISIEHEEEKKLEEFEIRVGQKIKFGNKFLSIKPVSKNQISYSNKGNIEFISADKLNDMFIFRKWKEGDKFIPLGMKNEKKISDFLTDCKIETIERKNRFILTNENNIVWVAGLRIDDRYKITSKTKKIYKIWMK